MIKKFNTYLLDSVKAKAYLFNNIEGINELSKAALEYIPFDQGEFFTILQNGLSNEKIHEFRNGYVGGGVIQEVAILLQDKFKIKKGQLCIFDDFNEDYSSEPMWDLFDHVGVHQSKEIYYIVSADQSSVDLLTQCFRASNCIWHSLCVFSKYTYNKNEDRTISILELENIARSAQYVLYLAYDAEGYIIWEKRD